MELIASSAVKPIPSHKAITSVRMSADWAKSPFVALESRIVDLAIPLIISSASTPLRANISVKAPAADKLTFNCGSTAKSLNKSFIN